MFAAVRLVYTGASCATNAMLSSVAREPMGCPPRTVAVPAVAVVRPTSRCSSVVLPAPLGPTRAARCPSGIVNVQSRSAQVRP